MSVTKPRILLMNDDGYLAPGILALYQVLANDYEVTVIAPEQDCSGRSSAITLDRPIALKQSTHHGFYFVTGTPADCGHLVFSGALDHVFDEIVEQRFDWVLSGINNGANLGDDLIYSGTLGAATEGALAGLPAIAFSLVNKGYENLLQTAKIARQIFEMARIQQAQLITQNKSLFWNVNIPNHIRYRADGLFETVFTRMGQRHGANPVEKVISPKGEAMFWIGPAGHGKHDVPGSDFEAVYQGKVSITPVTLDRTANN